MKNTHIVAGIEYSLEHELKIVKEDILSKVKNLLNEI